MSQILVVEDNDDLRTIIKDILEGEGHAVQTACDGSEVADIMAGTQFDLILTDILMPEKEGIQTILEVRHAQPDLKIIGMSGGGQGGAEHYLEMAREFGADATLQKPFTKAQLLEHVQTLLGTRTGS